MTILSDLINEDYGLEIRGHWGRALQHDSLVYDVRKDFFYFNSTDTFGDAYQYLIKVRGWKHDVAKEYLRENNYTATFIQTIKDKEEVITYPPLVDAFHDNLIENPELWGYWKNRLVTREAMIQFKLGYYNGYYTIPIYQDGLLKQIQLRRDSPKLIKNYYKEVGPLLFNSGVLNFVTEVYITEGMTGTILLSSHGIPSVAMNIGADGFQASWLKYFFNVKHITLLFDNDSAGNFGSIRVAKILGEQRCKIYNFWGFSGKGYALDDYFLDNGSWGHLKDLILNEGLYAYELPEYAKKNRA